MEYCKCGSILINDKCTNVHCPSKGKKLKDWVIDGRNMDFKKPVSYEEAAELSRRMNIKENRLEP